MRTNAGRPWTVNNANADGWEYPMSDWNERAADCAVAHHTYEHLSFEENTRHATGFVRGAKWQREQLRTEEAVERVARLLACLEPGEEWPSNEALGGNLTGTRDHEYRDGMRDQAREAIDALLEQEPRP